MALRKRPRDARVHGRHRHVERRARSSRSCRGPIAGRSGSRVSSRASSSSPLDPIAEWIRFEAFAPFALAFFDSVLAAPFAAPTTTAEVARLRREVDAVLAPLVTAMASSAMAA